MDNISKIAKAFINAKKAFNPALKDKTNPAFRSKYADLGACIEAVDDAFLSNGIVMYQETSEVESGVTVETVLLHESGECIRSGKLHVPASKQDPQGYGSALTYCRRYSLMAACGIAPEDDDGNAASQQRSHVRAANQGRPFDLNAALDWIGLSESPEEARERGKSVWERANEADHPKVKAAVEAVKQKFAQAA